MLKNKKLLLVFLLLVVIFSISTVSANDDIGNNTIDDVVLKDNVDNNVMLSSSNDIGNFTALQEEIDYSTSHDIYLQHDFYMNAGNEKEIEVYGNVTINGVDGNTIISAAGASRIFHINEGATVTLKNIVLQEGKADYGSAIYSEGDLVLASTTIQNNQATIAGSIYVKSGTLSLIASNKFLSNKAGKGGAIYMDKNADSLYIFSAFFYNNLANDSNGGAIYTAINNVQVHYSSFYNNTAKKSGGAIYIDEPSIGLSNISVSDATFKNNLANLNGGAIFSLIAIEVGDSEFINNHVVGEDAECGGAVYTKDSGIVINCNFTDNYALQQAGALYVGSNSEIEYCTFISNKATDYGGAIVIFGDDVNVNYCDFKYNEASVGTAIGVYEGLRLSVLECNNVNKNNSNTPAIYLAQDDGISFNMSTVVVLNASTVKAEFGETINLTAEVYISYLNVAGGKLYFKDDTVSYLAESLMDGTYVSEYIVEYNKNKLISASFQNAIDTNVVPGTVDSRILNLTVSNVELYYQNGSSIIAKLTYGDEPATNEKLVMNINGKNYEFYTDENGIVEVPIGLNAGEYIITTTYDGECGYASVKSTVTVLTTIKGENVTVYYRNGSGYYVKIVSGTGEPLEEYVVRMNINGVFYNRVTDENGIAFLPIGLAPGNYTITAESLYNGEKTSNNVEVLPTLVEGQDITVYHRNGSGYSIKVLDGQGNPISNVNVRMNVNGVFYTVTTDENGVATLPIGLSPGNYIITAEYNGYKTSNKITVLPVLVGSDVTLHYRDGTNYTVQVLDGQGQPLAGVNVTMNINGVFYNVTSDDKGIASLQIGLRPGKYTVTTIYEDHRTSNKVTVLT